MVGVVAPFVLGYGTWLLVTGDGGTTAVFVGATLTATSVGITARVLSDLNRLQEPESQVILGAAVIDDDKILYFTNQKKYAEALKTFSLPATITPTYADAYYWMGRTQEALAQKEEAKQNYQRAYSLDKSLTEAKAAAEKL